MKLTGKWTHEERVAVACAMLDVIRGDINAGVYSQPGRPNCTAVQYVLTLPADALNEMLDTAQRYLDDAAKKRGTDKKG